jgi:hypothetical protein
MKPTLFIGSSSESLDIAYAAQKNLEDVAEVVVWSQGIFELTKSYLESLIDALDDTEFGLFIFGADDVTRIRAVDARTARDNVVFELGLFIGRLGRERSFIIAPRDVSEFRLPSDLLGIHTATFQTPSRPDRWQAALGPACHGVRTSIRKHARAEAGVAQADQIDLLLPLVIPEAERKHLLNLAHGRTRRYRGRGSLRSELRHLRSMGLIKKRSGRNIGDIATGAVHDLAEFVELTELGTELAEKLER